MPATGHVIALPPDPDALDAIRAGLASVGIPSEVREPRPGAYVVEDTTLREQVRGARTGMALGALIGAAVGLVLTLAVPALRDLPMVGRLLLVAGVALQGTMPAMMWRMGRADHGDDDPVTLHEVGTRDRFVIVDDEPHEARARHVLEHHHAIFLDRLDPVRTDA